MTGTVSPRKWGGPELTGTSGLSALWARIGYRRSISPTPGLIGDVNRFENPDTGLYPNEDGQAPEWGINEEYLSASLRSNHRFGGSQFTPYAAGRYNLLLGVVDEGHAGLRLRRGGHAVESEIYYSVPTFDGGVRRIGKR